MPDLCLLQYFSDMNVFARFYEITAMTQETKRYGWTNGREYLQDGRSEATNGPLPLQI